MKNEQEYHIKLVGNVGKLFKEAISISGENPATALEDMIVKYHKQVTRNGKVSLPDNNELSYLKVGKIANIHLRRMLETEKVSPRLLESLQNKQYSKTNFDIQFPLLVKEGNNFETIRYYKKPLYINREKFYLCSQWFDSVENDDKSYLLYWIKEFQSNN